jgi:hypothetical protein
MNDAGFFVSIYINLYCGAKKSSGQGVFGKRGRRRRND